MIRRRGRRRKSEIVNFSIDTNEEHNVTFNTNQVNDVNDRDKNNISFGNLNIVIHSLKDEPFEPIVTNNTSINLNFLISNKKTRGVIAKNPTKNLTALKVKGPISSIPVS